jgi:hypothetical protein
MDGARGGAAPFEFGDELSSCDSLLLALTCTVLQLFCAYMYSINKLFELAQIPELGVL